MGKILEFFSSIFLKMFPQKKLENNTEEKKDFEKREIPLRYIEDEKNKLNMIVGMPKTRKKKY